MDEPAPVVRTLVLNVGNTSLFGGVFAGEKLVAQFRVPVREVTSVAGFRRRLAVRVRGRVDRVAFCSVVPRLTAKVAAHLRLQFSVVPLQLTTDSSHGLKIGYRVPRQLGTDRLGAALGARKLFPRQNAIIVDCGTATTVTALSWKGVLLGGAIFPGLALWPQMLASRTAQLPEQELLRPRVAVGRSTAAGLKSGFFHGHAGAIRETVGKIQAEAFGRAAVMVVGTGGHAPRFSGEGIFDALVPELVLVGLQQFAAGMAADRL